LDSRSQGQFGAEFVRLTSEQQDHILAGMERPALQIEAAVEPTPAVARFGLVEPALQQTSAEIALDFFSLLALHTRQGFYADPIYGGNKNRVGWKLIGFEGPESLAETHAGRFTTLPFFAKEQIDWKEAKSRGTET
jgi:gluconate 2-dehydrogenase gamma chain